MLASLHVLLGTKLTVARRKIQDRDDFQIWVPDSCGGLQQHETSHFNVHIDSIGDIHVPIVPLTNNSSDYLRDTEIISGSMTLLEYHSPLILKSNDPLPVSDSIITAPKLSERIDQITQTNMHRIETFGDDMPVSAKNVTAQFMRTEEVK